MPGSIAEAYVQIIPTTKGIASGIEKELGDAGEGAGKSAGKSAGSGFISTFKKIVVAAGIGKIVKDAMSAGGDLQQSFGGLETIYGDAAAAAKDYARAAASAGISANEYAEQAVSFGASLKQAYGGDTLAAMEAANTAILDMADNSAKMGTDIGSIQAAYQGFAKQNYTMLDNLKLGYGGTKTEMERLLADATELSGIEYNIDNLGDVYDAIHVIQEDLGLTGVAAEEAKTTLTGSMAAMKASFTNFLADLALGNDLSGALEQLTQSVVTFAGNVLPMIENIISAAPSALVGLFTGLAPSLIKSGAQMIASLAKGLAQAIPQLIGALPAIWDALVEGITEAWPILAEAGTQIIEIIGSGITAGAGFVSEALHGLWTDVLGGSEETWQAMSESTSAAWEAISSSLSGAWEGIKSAASAAGEGLRSFWAENGSAIMDDLGATWEMIMSKLSGVWEGIVAVAQSVFTALQDFWNTWGSTIMTGFAAVWDTVKTVFSASMDNIIAVFNVFAAVFAGDWSGAWEAVKALGATVWNGIVSILTSIWNGIKAVASSVWSVIGSTVINAWNAVKSLASTVWGAVTSAITSAWNAVASAAASVWEGISSTISSVWESIKTGISTAVNAVSSTVSSVFSSISSTVSSIWNGISSTISSVMDGIKTTVSNAIDRVKSFFDFEWSLPHIALPHFTISGEFSLSPLSVPTLGVSWYAKGAVLTGATIFGLSGNSLLGGGEAGPEAVAPVDVLQGYIRDAVGYDGDDYPALYKMDELIDAVRKMSDKLDNLRVYLNGDRLVGGITDGMDIALGDLRSRMERGIA